mmetsp:Transcript_8427/g.12920  ORF Transcript_8427/g.12920 Transcript_8427/m.12920 type:complete len:245 (-) Transcript_8427:149-883(-)
MSQTMSVFERLSTTQTASSLRKRVHRHGKTTTTANDKLKTKSVARNRITQTAHNEIKATSATRKLKSEVQTPSQTSKSLEQDDAKASPVKHMGNENVEKQKNTQSSITPSKLAQDTIHGKSINMIRLRSSSKYSPKSGFSDLSPSSLNLTQVLRNYLYGSATQQQVAHAIIEALWKRDFMPGKRWDIDGATVRQLEGKGVYAVEKEATWDWKDIYAVSSSKGTIRFLDDLKEIRIENYSHYCAG